MKTYSFNISDVNEQYGYHNNTGTSEEKKTKAMSTASGNSESTLDIQWSSKIAWPTNSLDDFIIFLQKQLFREYIYI